MSVLLRPPDWTVDAACLDMAGRDRDAWHDPLLWPEAKRVCATCPVVDECRTWALQGLSLGVVDGVYGGLTPGELVMLARSLGKPYRRTAQHGTRSRYVAGPCNDDGTRCGPCREAHRRWVAERRALHRQGLIPPQRQPEPMLVVDKPVGRGRRRATPGQYLLFDITQPPAGPRQVTHLEGGSAA